MLIKIIKREQICKQTLHYCGDKNILSFKIKVRSRIIHRFVKHAWDISQFFMPKQNPIDLFVLYK